VRVIAYFNPSMDVRVARDALLSRSGIASVACRAGHHWRPGQGVEHGFDACHAPFYPAIRAAYSAAGIHDLDGRPTPEPVVNELVWLPQADVVTVVCPGKFAREELAQHPAEGPIIAVNEAAFFLPRLDYLVSNDGFVGHMAGVNTDAVRVCRRAMIATCPSCRWFDLENIGIFKAISTTICALMLAAKMMKPKRVVLIGHDCIPGVGTGTGVWSEPLINMVKSDTSDYIRAMVERGITVEHVRWDADGARSYVETSAPSVPA
jgi:hypothetical protein